MVCVIVMGYRVDKQGSDQLNANLATTVHTEQTADLDALLKRHFGHNSFRLMQRRIITETLAGHDGFVLMPTGGGKSLCYQLPALVLPGVTVVVSPLIALMQDQVKALETNGICATFLNSSINSRQLIEREAQAVTGQFDLIYMAPERLMSPAGQSLLQRIRLSLLAIDEAHCISEWGHDFRPEYRMLGSLRSQFLQVPILALTATATPRVADDIVAQLHLRNPGIHRTGFERQNLFYDVRPKQRVFDQIFKYLSENATAEGIIYCHSRAATEQMAQKLAAKHIAALPYHAGLDSETRCRHQHEFVYGSLRVITATIAFGMGINKPDVRFVMHTTVPRNLEAYYQETGRAGRDGLPADCILFFSHADRAKIERFIEEKPDEREREHAYRQLQKMIDFAYATCCRTRPLLAYFGEAHDGDCGHCDNCKHPPTMIDATEDGRKLLSAVARTGQRFGLGYVIDVLRGSGDERINHNRHDQLSVFGLGGAQSKPYWRRLADTLIQSEQLAVSGDEYPTAHLTEASMPLLRGEARAEMVVPRVEPRRKKPRRATAESDGPVDAAMFEQLRTLRRQLAEQQQVPPYVIFSDASLRHMVQTCPQTDEQFLTITGVGQHKLKQYGPTFMAAIRQLRTGGDTPRGRT